MLSYRGARPLAWKIDCPRPLFTSDIYNLKPLRNILSVVSSPNIFSLHIQVGSNANRFIYITVSQSFAPSLSFLLFIECQRPGIFLFHLFNGIIPDLQPRGSIFRLPEVIFLKLIMGYYYEFDLYARNLKVLTCLASLTCSTCLIRFWATWPQSLQTTIPCLSSLSVQLWSEVVVSLKYLHNGFHVTNIDHHSYFAIYFWSLWSRKIHMRITFYPMFAAPRVLIQLRLENVFTFFVTQEGSGIRTAHFSLRSGSAYLVPVWCLRISGPVSFSASELDYWQFVISEELLALSLLSDGRHLFIQGANQDK